MYKVLWQSLEDEACRGEDATGLTKEEAEKHCKIQNEIWKGVAHHWIVEEGKENE